MNQVVIPIEATGLGRLRKRRQPKGRQVDVAALAEVHSALGDMPRRRDLLIEHLHCIQDRYGQLAMPHLVALAQELGLAMTEVYEVATFYHHFDVVREDADGHIAPPPALTVRVCEGIACEMAGARALIDRLPSVLGTTCAWWLHRGIGRCEKAPAALAGQNPVDGATVEAIASCVAAGAVRDDAVARTGYGAYRASGGYDLLKRSRRAPSIGTPCFARWKTPACAAWAVRVFRQAQMAHRGARAGATAHGRQYR